MINNWIYLDFSVDFGEFRGIFGHISLKTYASDNTSNKLIIFIIFNGNVSKNGDFNLMLINFKLVVL